MLRAACCSVGTPRAGCSRAPSGRMFSWYSSSDGDRMTVRVRRGRPAGRFDVEHAASSAPGLVNGVHLRFRAERQQDRPRRKAVVVVAIVVVVVVVAAVVVAAADYDEKSLLTATAVLKTPCSLTSTIAWQAVHSQSGDYYNNNNDDYYYYTTTSALGGFF